MKQKGNLEPKTTITPKDIAKADNESRINSSLIKRMSQWFKDKAQERHDKANYQGDHKWDYRV